MESYLLSSVHHDESTPLMEARLLDIMESDTPSPDSNHKQRRHRHHRQMRTKVTYPLPAVLQVTLGLLGLWSPLQRIKSAKTKEISFDTDNRDLQETWDDDEVDDSSPEHVDKNGNKCDPYSSDDEADDGYARPSAGGDRKCFVMSNICAFSYLLLSCCLMTYDFQAYLGFYWGKKKDVLHLVSYFTFLFQVMAIPFWCFYARTLYMTLGHRYQQGYPLFRAFLSTRVAFLRTSRYGAKRISWFCLLCFLAWPLTNAVLRFANDYRFKSCSRHIQTQKEITHWCAFLGYVFYGCFCYLIYIERLSFECEARQISIFSRGQASEKNIDSVRRRISKFYAHYNVLRRLIRTWMAFTMVTATWGLTSHLIWNYLVYSDNNIAPENIPVLNFLNLVVSTQKIMFFVVPCVAIGGLNLEHVWKRFKYEIARNRHYAHEAYWTAINRYIFEINVDHSGDLTPTLIFSAIGFYLGHMGTEEQEHERWNYPINDTHCNYSHAT